MDGKTIERALGIMWNINNETLSYYMNFKEYLNAKRGMLQATCSIFDPPGFVAAFILTAKLMVQQPWKFGCVWDSEVPPEILSKSTVWLSNVKNLSQISVLRCYFNSDSTVTEMQLHIFCDASEIAYGSVAYLRVSFKDGSHHVVVVMTKSRLAPIKTITLSKLELNAVHIGARLYLFLIHEMCLTITFHRFWTDSTLVLQYLHNTKYRFKIYIANRVTEILQILIISY